MPVPRGRKRYTPDPTKIVEALGADEYELLKGVLARNEIAVNLPGAWLRIQQQRLTLAQVHLDVAIHLSGLGQKGEIRPEKRSVISRAYYTMFCAVRAALSYYANGDKNDHKQLPDWLRKASLGSENDRNRVVRALNTYRAARNEADYSPFYPRPLGRDAKQAVAEARAVLRICKRWVKDTARERGATA